MKTTTYHDVREFLLGFLAKRLESQGGTVPEDIADDYDLLLSGLIDSLGLLELVAAIQQQFGSEIDFELLDSEEVSVVGPLCHFVAAQAIQRT